MWVHCTVTCGFAARYKKRPDFDMWVHCTLEDNMWDNCTFHIKHMGLLHERKSGYMGTLHEPLFFKDFVEKKGVPCG